MAPAAVPNGTTTPMNGANGTSGGLMADDNIKRFAAPSRPMSPTPSHTLFHPKTRCFV